LPVSQAPKPKPQPKPKRPRAAPVVLPPSRTMQVRDAPFEVRKRGVARFDLSDPYHLAVTISWPAFIALAFGSAMALNVVFASLYDLKAGAVQNLAQGDLLRAFFFSLETLATVGYGEMAPASDYGHVVAAIEILFGMAFTAIFTGILFVRFSKPQAKILFATRAVVTPHNGVPTLMIRIANGRLTMLTHAQAKLSCIMVETTEEGHLLRRFHDMALMRHDMPIFPLTWTLMHSIDEHSPLHGLTAQDLEDHQVRVFLSVQARDVGLEATVQDLAGFGHSQILFGKRYSDAVTIDDNGGATADIARLSLVE
jgi:inward rectifier potassium channel